MSAKFTYADLEYLESMSMGSNEMIVEMIDLFIEQIPEFTDGLAAHLSEADFAALGAMAHKAKSSVAVMGMNNLANDLKQLELSAKAGEDQETYPALVNRFIEQVKLTGEELGAYADTLR